MDRRPIFFTSDWHIGHKTVLKPTFDNRPFTDVDHMHRVLVNNFNSTVPENGITYFLGDVGLCKSDIVREVITKLNGLKIVVLGNHDKGANAMMNLGFDAALHGMKMVIAGEIVTMSHCPLRGVWREDTSDMKGTDGNENWHGEKRHARFTFSDEGQFHLHGHIHSPNRGKSQKILGKQYDVGVVANNYRPVSISQIESWIARYGKSNSKS